MFEIFDDFDQHYRLLDTGRSASIEVMPFLTHETTSFAQWLETLKCQADAVFSATVASSESFPTQSGTFFFTEYGLQLQEVLSFPVGTPLRSGQSVTLVRLGGKMVIDGETIIAGHSSAPPLQSDSQYLIFARLLKETGGFAARSIFVLSDTPDVSPDLPAMNKMPTEPTLGLLLSTVCR